MGTGGDGPVTRPAAGMLVQSSVSPAWGTGTVLAIQGNTARVLFSAHPDRRQVLVLAKTLVVVRPGNWASASQERPPARESRKASPNARKPTGRRFSTTTQDEAIREFLKRYPGGFTGAEYLSTERNYKLNAHEVFRDHLGGGRLAELLKHGRIQECVKGALQAEQKTNLLSIFEKARLSQALREGRFAERVFSTLAEVIERPAVDETAFSRYLDAVDALPSSGDRRATWPIATILPFLARPDLHLFIKPIATRAAAERLQFDLQYRPGLNWNTYRRAQQLASDLRAQLADYGCRDMIDVQSFMWLMA